MDSGIDCVYARLRSYEGLCQIAHVIATHACLESRSYLFPVLQTAKIVYIDESYQSNTIVSTENYRPQIVFQFDYGYFFTD